MGGGAEKAALYVNGICLPKPSGATGWGCDLARTERVDFLSVIERQVRPLRICYLRSTYVMAGCFQPSDRISSRR